MRRQRRKRHGKRGRAVLKRREDCLVPQWTEGGVRQHGQAGVLAVLLSSSAAEGGGAGRGYCRWRSRVCLGTV